MSDIWHTTKEKPMLHRDVILCGNGWSMPIDIIPETVNTICWENVEKWCYLDDLLACEQELDRTRKALGQAKKALNFINDNWDNVDCGRAELGACAFNGLEDISGWESDVDQINEIKGGK